MMKILIIERKQKTEHEEFTLITFKGFWGKIFTETCITPINGLGGRGGYNGTIYASTGESIPVSLWDVVNSFLRTNDECHDYKRAK